MALGLYPGTAEPAATYARMVDEIAALGATHLALVVSWAQADVRSSQVAPAADVTIADELVKQLIRRARGRGLKVVMFPILTVRETRPGQWRGTVAPGDRAAWWRSYERFILHYAGIAAAEKVEVMLVGSELGSTEGWREHWYHLIGQVKRRYSGPVAYSANWDHYQHVSFWRRLDIFGVTGYFELTDDRDASVADLEASWRRARDRMLAVVRKRPGVKLWLTEVGYVSRDGAATRPWDYTLSSKIDLEEQRRCYEAMRRAWAGVDELAGMIVWNWFGAGGANDGGYTPKGKPAERVLRRWWRQGVTIR